MAATRAKKKTGAANPHGIACYHVNARFSRGLSDVGEFQGGKIFLILWFCLQAVWLRFRHGVKNFYYVPAPGKKVALYRDWLVMFLCRPFFENLILHWHAAGLAKWLETETVITCRAATYRLFKPVDLSLVLSRYNFATRKNCFRAALASSTTAFPTHARILPPPCFRSAGRGWSSAATSSPADFPASRSR